MQKKLVKKGSTNSMEYNNQRQINDIIFYISSPKYLFLPDSNISDPDVIAVNIDKNNLNNFRALVENFNINKFNPFANLISIFKDVINESGMIPSLVVAYETAFVRSIYKILDNSVFVRDVVDPESKVLIDGNLKNFSDFYHPDKSDLRLMRCTVAEFLSKVEEGFYPDEISQQLQKISSLNLDEFSRAYGYENYEDLKSMANLANEGVTSLDLWNIFNRQDDAIKEIIRKENIDEKNILATKGKEFVNENIKKPIEEMYAINQTKSFEERISSKINSSGILKFKKVLTSHIVKNLVSKIVKIKIHGIDKNINLSDRKSFNAGLYEEIGSIDYAIEKVIKRAIPDIASLLSNDVSEISKKCSHAIFENINKREKAYGKNLPIYKETTIQEIEELCKVKNISLMTGRNYGFHNLDLYLKIFTLSNISGSIRDSHIQSTDFSHWRSAFFDVVKNNFPKLVDSFYNKALQNPEILKGDKSLKEEFEKEFVNLLIEMYTDQKDFMLKQMLKVNMATLEKFLCDIFFDFSKNLLVKSFFDETSIKERLTEQTSEIISPIQTELESTDKKFIDINLKQYFTEEDLRRYQLAGRFSNSAIYGFKVKKEQISKDIESLKEEYIDTFKKVSAVGTTDSYSKVLFKTINIESIENFFNTLKILLEDQLKKEEEYLNGKSPQLKTMTSEFSINNLNIIDSFFTLRISKYEESPEELIKGHIDKITKEFSNRQISSVEGEVSLIDPFLSIVDNLKELLKLDNHFSILTYFYLFPDEFSKFFSIQTNQVGTLYNKIKEIINFYNSNSVAINDIYRKTVYGYYFVETGISDLPFLIYNSEEESGDPGTNFKVYKTILNVIKKLAGEQAGKKLLNNIVNNSNTQDIEKILRDINGYGYSYIKKNIELFKNYFNNKIYPLIFAINKNIADTGSSRKEKLEKLYSIATIIHAHSSNDDGFRSANTLLQSSHLKDADNKRKSMALDVMLKIITLRKDLDKNFGVIEQILAEDRSLIIQRPEHEEYLKTMKRIVSMNVENPEIFDQAIDILSPNITDESDDGGKILRYITYLLKVSTSYSNVKQWMSIAKKKNTNLFELNMQTKNFRFRVLNDKDPTHFTIGSETQCCQQIGGAGENAAIDSFINPLAGVVVLETVDKRGNWNLVAQSYFHFVEIKSPDKIKKAIILDNIEAVKLREDFDINISNAYNILGQYLKQKGFDIVACGKDYTNVIDENDFNSASMDDDPRYFEIESVTEDDQDDEDDEDDEDDDGLELRERYTDFDNSDYFDLLNPKRKVNMPNDISDVTFDLSKYSAVVLSIIHKNSQDPVIRKIAKLFCHVNKFAGYKHAKKIAKILIA